MRAGLAGGRLHPAPTAAHTKAGEVDLRMTILRAVTMVALATGFTCVVGAASAQYYPSGPAYPPRAVAPVDADDSDYAPPPPPYYGPRPPAAVYPGAAQPQPHRPEIGTTH